MSKLIPNLNPYDVLEVSPGASNKEITIAFTIAMKKRKYSPSAIAIARKSLIDPQARIIADYLRPILPVIQRFKRSDYSILDAPISEIEFLSDFDNLPSEIELSNEVLVGDKRLGEALFSSLPIE